MTELTPEETNKPQSIEEKVDSLTYQLSVVSDTLSVHNKINDRTCDFIDNVLEFQDAIINIHEKIGNEIHRWQRLTIIGFLALGILIIALAIIATK